MARRCLRRSLRPTISIAGRGRSAGRTVAAGCRINRAFRVEEASETFFRPSSAAIRTSRPASVICHPASDRTTSFWPNRSSSGKHVASCLIRSVQSLPLVFRMARSALSEAIVEQPSGWHDNTFRMAICNATQRPRLGRAAFPPTRCNLAISRKVVQRKVTLSKSYTKNRTEIKAYCHRYLRRKRTSH